MRLTEALILNVASVPQHTTTGSVPPNPSEMQGWQTTPAPVQTGGKKQPQQARQSAGEGGRKAR